MLFGQEKNGTNHFLNQIIDILFRPGNNLFTRRQVVKVVLNRLPGSFNLA